MRRKDQDNLQYILEYAEITVTEGNSRIINIEGHSNKHVYFKLNENVIIILELSFDYVHEADDVVDLPMGDDYYYDDYMYEVDAKPLSIPMTERPLKSIKRPTQSIKLNKQELLELYGDLTDVLDELPAMKQQSSMISRRPMPTRPPTSTVLQYDKFVTLKERNIFGNFNDFKLFQAKKKHYFGHS